MADETLDITSESYSPFGFSVARRAWDFYQIETLTAGKPIRGQEYLFAVRMLSNRMNERHSAQTYPSLPVRAGQLISLGLINEILRYVFDLYCAEDNPGALTQGFSWVAGRHGAATVELPARAFVTLYPPYSVTLEGGSTEEYLEGASSPCRTAKLRCGNRFCCG
jgi:hypothetical protein